MINEQEICTPELIKTVFDVDVQMSLNPQTGKPFLCRSVPVRRRHYERLRAAAAAPTIPPGWRWYC